MSNKRIKVTEAPQSHFIKRAQKYNSSSRWVEDPVLIKKIFDLAEANSEARVLDIAIGTGKVAKAFHGRVKEVIGVDICPEMIQQAKQYADKIILAPAENLPLKNDIFDICVCRQGLQFMDLEEVVSEIYRVLKPGGRVVLCHLTAYGKEDEEETFYIQKLRNPARRNFFLPDDVMCLLEKKFFRDIETFEYLTKESVNQWIDTGAIDEDTRIKIKEMYKNTSDDFKKIHNIQFEDGDIFDTMRMSLVKSIKR